VLYPTACGLTTSPIPYRQDSFQIDFDFLTHQLQLFRSNGAREHIALCPQSVAEFYAQVMGALERIGVLVKIHTLPNEVPNPIPLDQDRQHASYDADAAQRFWRILLSSHRVLSEFRTEFLGKVSPVHFFWGSFDLAVTRFSGRKAPLLTSSPPGLPLDVSQEAYSHEVASVGFWPGNGGLGYPAFYAYAYPEPKGFKEFPVGPQSAFYHPDLKEFIFPYEAMRTAADPEKALFEFLETTYRAAAQNANWDPALECKRGRPEVVRPVE
jgi:hypothetical protein